MKRIILSLFVSAFVFSLYAVDRNTALIDSLENTLFPVVEYGKINFKDIHGRAYGVYDFPGEGLWFSEGMCAVKVDGKWGFINNKGVMVIPAMYDSKWHRLHFAEGLAVVHRDGKWGAINKIGKIVIPFEWDVESWNSGELVRFYEGRLLVKDKKWGFIDVTGKNVVPCIYDDGKHFSEGLAAVKQKGKWGFIDKGGNIVVSCVYEDCKHFSEGLAAVKQKGKWGFIDKNGKLKISCVYEDVKLFSEGLAAVKQNGRWGFIDGEGRCSISFNYDYVPGVYIYGADEGFSFKTGFSLIANKDKYGVINNNGEIIVPLNYESYNIDRSGDGIVCVLRQKNHFDVGVVKDGEMCMMAVETEWRYNAMHQGYQWLYNELKKEMAAELQKEIVPQDVVKKGDVRDVAPEIAVAVEKKQPTPPLEKTKAEVDAMIPFGIGDNDNTFALIFANEDYSEEGVQNVDYAVNDGEIFKEYCIKTLRMPQDNVHIRKNATLNQIRSEINWVKNVADAYDGEAKFIIYYAGHGVPDEKTKDAYLLPSDGLANDPQSGYSLAALYKELGALPAQQVLVFLDACFSGAQRSGDMLMAARATVMKPRPLTPKGNMVVFTASYGDETAYPYKDKGHGLFTYFLLKKLNETKGDATLGDIYEYVREKVDRYSIVKNNKRQTPTVTMSDEMRLRWRQLKLK